MKINILSICRFCGYAGLLIALQACSGVAVLDPQGPIAAAERHLLFLATGLMLLIVVPVIIMTIWFAWRYRASNHRAVYLPNWADSLTLELIWWAIPIAIIVILATITWISSHKLDPYRPLDKPAHAKMLTVQAVSLLWKWLFIYPEQGIATINYLAFPTGTQVRVLITAEGPMNGFQIPQLAGQIYAMAGMQTKLHFIADKDGTYIGRGVSFTGDGFANMTFTAHSMNDQQFKHWVNDAKRDSKVLNWANYQGLKIIDPNYAPVRYYGKVESGLFDKIMMSYMMPVAGAKSMFSAHGV